MVFKRNLPLGNGSVEFMLTTSSTIGGSGLSQTVTFTILNNSRPDVSNLKVIPENQSSYERDLSIRADISEPDSEPTTLTIEYSLNGDNGPWRKATSVSGKVSGIVSETAKLVWHSNYDFDTDQVGVKIKIIVDDGNTQPRELVYPLNTTLTVNNGPIELSSWSDMPNRTATATIRCDEADGAIYDNKLYAICADLTGSLGGGRVSIFDFTTNTWEVESNEINLVQSRSDYTSTLVNGQFYTYGGQNSGSAVNASTNSLFEIDPTTSSVNTILSGGIARRNHTAVGYENKLYIHGGILDEGFSTTNTMDIFDTITNQWTTGSPSPSNRYGHDSVLYNGKIYLFGGRSQVGANDVFLNVEVYDIQSNSWSTLSGTLVFQTMELQHLLTD